jgi:hypothetical protein
MFMKSKTVNTITIYFGTVKSHWTGFITKHLQLLLFFNIIESHICDLRGPETQFPPICSERPEFTNLYTNTGAVSSGTSNPMIWEKSRAHVQDLFPRTQLLSGAIQMSQKRLIHSTTFRSVKWSIHPPVESKLPKN